MTESSGTRITERFFDLLKMAESITDLRTREYKDSRKLEQNKNEIRIYGTYNR